MIAANVMTSDIYTLGADGSMSDALNLIAEKRVRQVPVVDGERRVAGVITPRSLLRAILPKYITGGLITDVKFAPELPGFIKGVESLCNRRIEEVMERDFTAVSPQTSTMELAVLFTKHERPVDSILVVDDGRRLLGIISPWDVFRRLCEYTEKKKER